MRRFVKYSLLLLLLGGISGGCSPEDEATDASEPIEIPISFNLLSSGSALTKAYGDVDGKPTKPAVDAREVYVDRVALYVYERKADGVYADNEEGFYLSPDNAGKVLPCQRQSSFPFFTAKGRVSLRKNHQYRINAVAYSEAKGEREWFERKGDRFDHTRLSLVNEPELETPELFFGTVVYGGSGEEYAGGDTLFTYERIDQDKGRALLTGWLYRCVAGIELRLGNMPDSIRKVELLADSIHTTVNARTYADFLSPYDMKRDGSYKHYVIGVDSLMEGEDTWTDGVMGDSAHIVGANLLPVCTSLSLRVTTRSGREEYTSLRLKDKDEECNSDAPKLRSLPDDGGNGTGIIPGKPDNSDPDDPDKPAPVNPFRVCFLRNNYYRIKGDYQSLVTMEYILQVSVNPNWEGDVNLPLGK